jgi:hypothetical protein
MHSVVVLVPQMPTNSIEKKTELRELAEKI